MLVGPLVLVTPLVGLFLTRGHRTLAGLGTTALVLWLNAWWALPLANVTASLPDVLLVPKEYPSLMIVGHLVAVALFIAMIGVLSPRPGSPTDLAIRAARRGDHLAAGEFWLQAGRTRRAYRSFVRAHAWNRAADVARTAGRLREAADLLQREGGSALGAAAQLLARSGDEAGAQQLWSRYGTFLVENRQSDLAIDAFQRAGDLKRAASAAELAYQEQRLTPASADAAIRVAREAKRPELGAAIATMVGRYREAGDLLLAAENPLEAAKAFERAGEPLRAADALRLAGREEDAARLRGQRLAAAGQFDQAAQEYQSAGLLAEAAEALLRLGRWPEASDLFRRAGKAKEAAELMRRNGEPAQAARLFAEVEEWGEAGTAWEEAGELGEAAACFRLAGDYERAISVLARAGKTSEHAALLAEVGRVEEGFLVLYGAGDLRGAWDLLAGYGGTFPGIAEPLMRLARWLNTQGEVTGAISALQRATAGLPVNREVLDPLYQLAQLLEEHRDYRTAEATLQKIVDFDYGFRDAAQRLHAVASQRAAHESQISGVFRVSPAGEILAASPPEAASRYVLEQELGRGGMGVVYRAFDQRLGRTVAIKVLNPRQHTPEALRRFEREARAAAALSHPGIVHIYDFDRGFESYFISMEFVSGPTLTQLLREEFAFVRHNLLPIMRQIADAVAYAHARHVVHRDLKPANMVLADRRQVKILDFGIARRLDELEMSASGATGTPYYMAPEQILGEDPDERTDVYSLGVSFFQMATGRLPFTTGNVLRSHLEQAPPDPRELSADIDATLGRLILRCLAKDPAQRFRDGGALLAALSAPAEEKPR